NLLLSKIVRHKLNLFYYKEIERNNWTIIDTEKEFESKIQINDELYNLKAKIDRIDKTPFGNIIIDYKTGSTKAPLNEKNILNTINTDRQTIQKTIKSFQLIIYKYLYEAETSNSVENCVLYSLKTLDFTSLFKENSNDKEQLYSICLDKLKYVISEINSDLPFKSESYDKTDCKNCPYFYLCR
ncbi:MAG: PD-(D/E)XK nuclease family protein, partial [Endomicrobiaceae bacterium]|nr:PD-(D/E)XK nuclease family protein [Endomicrobiaceae bacterium]